MLFKLLYHSQMETIVQIDAGSFGPEAWSAERFDAELRRNDRRAYMVSPDWPQTLKPAAYAILEPVGRALRVVRVAVAPERRRSGLLVALMHFLQMHYFTHPDPKRDRLTVSVPEDNLPALLAFRSAGFRAVRPRRGDTMIRMVWRAQPATVAGAGSETGQESEQ